MPEKPSPILFQVARDRYKAGRFNVMSEDGKISFTVSASSRGKAQDKVRADYPDATFMGSNRGWILPKVGG